MTHPKADLFRDFAAKIEKNDGKDFAGAFLIIAPNGEAISSILVGEPDVASFFGMVKTKLDAVITKISEEEKRTRTFGR
jgi:hypothetical protein